MNWRGHLTVRGEIATAGFAHCLGCTGERLLAQTVDKGRCWVDCLMMEDFLGFLNKLALVLLDFLWEGIVVQIEDTVHLDLISLSL